jgi:hypothetical protein
VTPVPQKERELEGNPQAQAEAIKAVKKFLTAAYNVKN